MANAWITHLKNVHKTLPKGTSLKHAMKMAKKTYKKIGNPKKHRRSHRNKKHRRSHKKRGGAGEEKPVEGEEKPVPPA